MDYQKIATRIAPLVQAVAEGKTLQFRDPKLKGMWEDVYSEGLHFYENYEYRIKPNDRVEWRLLVNETINAFAAVCQRGGSVLEQVTAKNKINTLLNNIPKED